MDLFHMDTITSSDTIWFHSAVTWCIFGNTCSSIGFSSNPHSMKIYSELSSFFAKIKHGDFGYQKPPFLKNPWRKTTTPFGKIHGVVARQLKDCNVKNVVILLKNIPFFQNPLSAPEKRPFFRIHGPCLGPKKTPSLHESTDEHVCPQSCNVWKRWGVAAKGSVRMHVFAFVTFCNTPIGRACVWLRSPSRARANIATWGVRLHPSRGWSSLHCWPLVPSTRSPMVIKGEGVPKPKMKNFAPLLGEKRGGRAKYFIPRKVVQLAWNSVLCLFGSLWAKNNIGRDWGSPTVCAHQQCV